MGTNYYALVNPCPHCGRPEEETHIGKSSYGWTFSFHATEEIQSYDGWLEFLSQDNILIKDEYKDEISLEEFKKIVENRIDKPKNHAVEYPNNSFCDNKGHSFSWGEFS